MQSGLALSRRRLGAPGVSVLCSLRGMLCGWALRSLSLRLVASRLRPRAVGSGLAAGPYGPRRGGLKASRCVWGARASVAGFTAPALVVSVAVRMCGLRLLLACRLARAGTSRVCISRSGQRRRLEALRRRSQAFFFLVDQPCTSSAKPAGRSGLASVARWMAFVTLSRSCCLDVECAVMDDGIAAIPHLSQVVPTK